MFFVVIHNVRSVLNVGSIFRTADGVGADKIYLTGYTPGPDTHGDKIAKTALGAEESVPWERVKRIGDLLKKLKKESVQVIALEQTKTSIDYWQCKPQKSFALIVGNEVTGVRNVSHNVAIEIPMRGKKESLNVAVAFGVAAYDLTRKK